ncbi:unnamed protein product [Moneuplotes crassus]|uniref:Uncharacterized protein n=1 Tax=Euplotes crassus TaxID=5936 RepID=A0AAD1XBP3_EUPCR|nr:unnamed protein product [Moneuplotes crassus]
MIDKLLAKFGFSFHILNYYGYFHEVIILVTSLNKKLAAEYKKNKHIYRENCILKIIDMMYPYTQYKKEYMKFYKLRVTLNYNEEIRDFFCFCRYFHSLNKESGDDANHKPVENITLSGSASVKLHKFNILQTKLVSYPFTLINYSNLVTPSNYPPPSNNRSLETCIFTFLEEAKEFRQKRLHQGVIFGHLVVDFEAGGEKAEERFENGLWKVRARSLKTTFLLGDKMLGDYLLGNVRLRNRFLKKSQILIVDTTSRHPEILWARAFENMLYEYDKPIAPKMKEFRLVMRDKFIFCAFLEALSKLGPERLYECNPSLDFLVFEFVYITKLNLLVVDPCMKYSEDILSISLNYKETKTTYKIISKTAPEFSWDKHKDSSNLIRRLKLSRIYDVEKHEMEIP